MQHELAFDDLNTSIDQLVPAVEYVRMSTEHQRYSVANQSAEIRQYAVKHGLNIIRTYSDMGKSGVSLKNRSGLQNLLHDVQTRPDFKVILVLDISRWGRFQDADESAHYEYICRLAGVQVQYCAEQFNNDISPLSAIIKSVKRAMAGEYSRELSVKVFTGQCRLFRLGYRQGGSAIYGVRRVLVDADGGVKGTLQSGEHKSIQSDHVILMPGPQHEQDVVNQIFEWFVADNGGSETAITRRLNEGNIPYLGGRRWHFSTVRNLLKNQIYIATATYNRTSIKLNSPRCINPSSMWLQHPCSFEPIVPPELFYKAQAVISQRKYNHQKSTFLTKLSQLYQKHGYINPSLMRASSWMPSLRSYSNRFGTMRRVYERIGYMPMTNTNWLVARDYRRILIAKFLKEAVRRLGTEDWQMSEDRKSTHFYLGKNLHVAVVVMACREGPHLSWRWTLHKSYIASADLIVAVRLDGSNRAVRDYYVFPYEELRSKRLHLKEHNPRHIEAYRMDNLDHLWSILAHLPLQEESCRPPAAPL